MGVDGSRESVGFVSCQRTRHLSLVGIAALTFWILGIALHATLAIAQESKPGVVGLGDLVVTGSSGTIEPPAGTPLPAGVNTLDETLIDPNGASLKVFDVRNPGGPPEGQLINAPVKFQAFARDIGQVFGLALDKADPPNIYATSTAVHGLQIVVPDADGDGRPERLKLGQPGAQWMDGQFGTARGGGPGTVWKINGETGEISKFADIVSNGITNSGPGLGNIAYDRKNNQFFVSDRDTGLIHRLSIDGADLGTYDHGLQGRPANGLEALPDDAQGADITNPAFDAEDSSSWGMTPPERRIWGLAVRSGRLYYAVDSGPQIWSVGINADGSLGSDSRWELDVPSDPNPYPVSDIAFQSNGRLLLAQRGGVISRYDYSQYHTPRKTRVLRYRHESPDDPATPSRWIAEPEDYAIGFPGNHRNSAGGIAIGYGYRKNSNGTYGRGSCEGTLWSTGDALRDNPVHGARLAQGGPTIVHGLQGNALNLVRPHNEPPWASYFVDYDSQFDDPQASGHVGDVEIPRKCGGSKRADILDLRILKRAQPVRCTAGNQCLFAIEIKNTGTKIYTGPLIIQDVAHDSAVLVGSPPPGWECKEAFPGIGVYECSIPSATLNPGEVISIDLTFQLPPWWTRPVYNNCVDLLVPGAGVDQRPYNNRSCDYVPICTPGDPLCVPDLMVEKFGLFGACDFAGLCEFVVRITNVGAANYSGPLNVHDFATTPGATMVDWTPQPDWACAAGAPDTYDCTLAGPVTLAPGEFREFIILVQGPPIAPSVTHVRNCVYFDWKGLPGDPNPHNEYACAEISTLPPGHPDARPMVSIEKTAISTCSNSGAGTPWVCGYFVEITNSGTAPLNGPIEFTDEVTANPATMAGWFGGAWACAPGIGSAGPFTCTHPPIPGGLAPGDSLTVLVAFELPAATPVPSWELNCAKTKWDNDGDGAEEEHEACALALVCTAGSAECPNDLAVVKYAQANPCPKGANCQFEVYVENISDTNFAGPLVVNDIPDVGAGAANVTGPGWACAPAGGSYTCTNPAGIPAGGWASFGIEFPIPAGFAANQFNNCAKLPPGPGNDFPFNDENCALAVVPNVLPADLAPHSDTTCKKGTSCQLPARIDNKGEQTFTGSAGVRGTLSPALQITKITSQTPGLDCKTTGNAAYECSGKNLSIKSGDAVKYELTASVPANYPHSQVSHIKNMVWPDRAVKDVNPENDQHISIIKIEEEKKAPPPPPPTGQPDLAVSKVARQAACRASNAAICGFNVTIVNVGEAPYSGSIRVNDTTTPSVVSLKGYSGGQWRCQSTGGSSNCFHPETTLAPGRSLTLSLNLKVPPSAGGSVTNCATLSWGGAQQTGGSVRDVQSALTSKGFNPGPVDGKPGGKTANAIRAYQQQNGLPVSGRIDQQLLASLFGQPGGSAGDANPTNDQACATASIIGQPPPPPPPACTGGRFRNNSGACVCPSSKPVWTGRVCIPRPPQQCTGGRYRNNKGICVCPANKPNWSGSFCFAKEIICTGGRYYDQRKRSCVCPANTPIWSGSQCIPGHQVCSGGRIYNERSRQCVCPANKPIWTGSVCVPRPPQQCSGGRIRNNYGNCVCPANLPIWTGQICLPKIQICSGGRTFNLKQKRCVCPPNKPVWSGSQCNPAHQVCSGGRTYNERLRQCVCPSNKPIWNGQKCTKPSGCSGGRIKTGHGQCVCPSNKPSWNGKQCVLYQTNPGLPPQYGGGGVTPRPTPNCSGGRIRVNGQCKCPSNKPIWAGNKCRKLPGGIKFPGVQIR